MWFGHPEVQLIEKYDGRNDPCNHLEEWIEVFGAKPQPDWVHLFCHTLDIILMSWYLEMELCHGTEEWDIFHQGFFMKFNFKDGFESINEALQEVKEEIFRIPQDPLDLVQPNWTTQLSQALECHNVTAEEKYEDVRKINILETKGHREVEGLQLENPDITDLLKTRQVNISMEVEPKFAKIGGY